MKRSLHLVSAHSLFNSSVAAFVNPNTEIHFCSSSLGSLQQVLATKSRDVRLSWTVHGCGRQSRAGIAAGTASPQTQAARALPAAKADIPAPRENSSREQDTCILSRNQVLKSKSLF